MTELSDDLTHHLRYVWEQIGMDVLIAVADTTRISYPAVSRDDVVELVMDCDRIRTFCESNGSEGLAEEIEELYKLDFNDRLNLVTGAFEDTNYGY